MAVPGLPKDAEINGMIVHADVSVFRCASVPILHVPHKEASSCLVRSKNSSVSLSSIPYFRYTQSA
jgi:hypothetical protein